jgi:glycerophosphoryl diester phosphodiesterase
MDLGADGIETDICVTNDGRFLLWHDADPSETIALARQTGRECLAYTPDVPALVSKHRRPIRDLSFEEFRENYGYRRRRGGLADLMAGDDAPEVPAATLDDLFAWIDTERRLALVCLDVKLAAKQTDAARDLFRIVSTFMAERAAKSPPEIRFLTPDEDVARALLAESKARPHDHRIRISGDFELPGVLAEARRVGFRDVSMGIGQRLWPGFRDEVMEVIRARDRGDVDSLVVWTLSEPDRLRELVAAGVDGILTDDPPLLRMIVRERAMRAL